MEPGSNLVVAVVLHLRRRHWLSDQRIHQIRAGSQRRPEGVIPSSDPAAPSSTLQRRDVQDHTSQPIRRERRAAGWTRRPHPGADSAGTGKILTRPSRFSMRITSKGQVTIPQAIREQAGLHPNCEVQFRLVDGQVVLEKAAGQAEQRSEEALGRLRAYRPRPGLSTAAILALYRRPAVGILERRASAALPDRRPGGDQSAHLRRGGVCL